MTTDLERMVAEMVKTALLKQTQPEEEEKKSVFELFKTNEEGFYEYCHFFQKERISETSYKDYVRAYERYGTDISKPDDLIHYNSRHEKPLTQKFLNGTKKLFTYLEVECDYVEFNGFPMKKWRNRINNVDFRVGIRETPKEITTVELREWYNDIPQKYKPLFYLLCVSGTRYAPFFKFLRLPSKERMPYIEVISKESPIYGRHLKTDVLRVDLTKFNADTGTKKNGYIYFPIQCLEMLKTVECKITDRGFFKACAPNTINNRRVEEGKRGTYSIKQCRKWFSNELALLNVPESSIERLTSKVSSSVLASNYLALDRNAVIEYSKIQAHLYNALPFPKF